MSPVAAGRKLVLLLMLILALSVRGTAQPATAAQIRLWRQQMRHALYIPDPLPTASPESYGSFSPTPGVIAERVTYRTAYDLRVPAIVYRPATKPRGKMPAIVVVNGHGADKSSWDDPGAYQRWSKHDVEMLFRCCLQRRESSLDTRSKCLSSPLSICLVNMISSSVASDGSHMFAGGAMGEEGPRTGREE